MFASGLPSRRGAGLQIAAAAEALAAGLPAEAVRACDRALAARPLAAEAFLLRAQAHLSLAEDYLSNL